MEKSISTLPIYRVTVTDASDDLPDKDELMQLDEDECRDIVTELAESGVVSWTTLAEEVFERLQPPQSSTKVSRGGGWPGYVERHNKNERWPPARRWMYAKYGRCSVTGKLSSLEHDHVIERDILGNEGDRLENLRFLNTRANQSRSHAQGNVTEWGTAATIAYLIYTQEPASVEQLEKLGKKADLTVRSSTRYEEGWALALALDREGVIDVETVHPSITKDELKEYREYYRKAEDYLLDKNQEIESEYSDELETRNKLQNLLRKRSAQTRKTAVKSVGMLETSEVREITTENGTSILEKDNPLSDDEKSMLLQLTGLFTDGQINEIVSNNKIPLIYVLDGDEMDSLLETIFSKFEELREEHLPE